MKPFLSALLLLSACAPARQAGAPEAAPVASVSVTPCTNCAEWNVPHAPVPLYGTTYYVGTNGLGAVLVTSPEGHILIDGALQESAPLIAANVAALGFRMADVKLILSTHAHFDHAGGLAALQQMSGAPVAASPASAAVLEAGHPGPDDPQYAELLPIAMAPVQNVRRLADGEIVRVGPLALTAHFTPGHTAGGTTWTWTACADGRCLNLVYADSLTPVSEDDYQFSNSTRYPTILADFERSFAAVEALPCDVLVTPHPGASDLFERIEAGTLVDTTACTRYAAAARTRLATRLETERAGR